MGTLQAISTQPAPAFAQKELAARNAISDYLALLKNWNQTRFAVVGNGTGTVTVADRTNFIYARLGNSSGDVIEARNLPLLDAAQGDTVLVRREQPGFLGPWLVIDWYGAGAVPLEACACECVGTLTLRANAQIDAYTAVSPEPQMITEGNYSYAWWREGNTYPETFRFAVIDVSNPTNPTVVGSTTYTVPTVAGFTQSIGIGLAKRGNNVYAPASLRSSTQDEIVRFLTFDVSTPAAPVLSSDALVSESGVDVEFNGIKVWEAAGVVYLATVSGAVGLATNHLKIYNITNPAAPALVSTTASVGFSWEIVHQRFTYQSGYLYMLKRATVARVDAVDVSTPAAPVIVSTFNANADDLNCITISSDHRVYVGAVDLSGNDVILELNYANPASPSEITRTAALTGGVVRFVDECGGYVFSDQRDTGSGADSTIRVFSPLATLLDTEVIADKLALGFHIDGTHLYLSMAASPNDGKPYIVILTC